MSNSQVEATGRTGGETPGRRLWRRLESDVSATLHGVVPKGGSALAESTVEFENDRVRVSRVKQTGAAVRPAAARRDRLIVYLENSDVRRIVGDDRQQISRRAGDVVWRDASKHTIEVIDDGPHDVLIIELKT